MTTTYQENIRAALHQATEEVITLGRAWYPTAQRFARRLARRGGVSVDTSAAVVAALSPRLSWRRNQEAAEALIVRGERISGVLQNRLDAAERILSGVPIADVLRTPKVDRFYRSIMWPLGRHACIDTWAGRVALGDRTATDQAIKRILQRKGGYESLEAAYVAAGEAAGLASPEIQAITWIVYRGRAD